MESDDPAVVVKDPGVSCPTSAEGPSSRHSTAPPLGYSVTEQARSKDTGIVHDQEVTWFEEPRQVGNRGMLDGAARPVEGHQA